MNKTVRVGAISCECRHQVNLEHFLIMYSTFNSKRKSYKKTFIAVCSLNTIHLIFFNHKIITFQQISIFKRE